MNTYQLSRFWIMFIIVLLMISGLWGVGTTQPIVAAKPNLHKLTAESTDMAAHAVGSEWHDKNKSPLVVDFDKTSPNTPDGINQWLQSQGVKLLPMPKAGISSKKKMLVLRMAFADRTGQRYTDAQIQTNWFDKIQTLFQKMSNGNFPGWDVTIKDSVTLTTFGGLSAINRNNYDSTDWSTAGASLDRMFARYIALAPDKAALFAEINQADTITILLNNGALTSAIGAYSWSRSFVFPAPVNKTINKGIILMDEDQYHRVDGDDVIWGALAHEMAHAVQQYAGFRVGSNHPSNYNSNFELLDVNMPGQSTDYMKSTGFKDWLPASQTIAITSNGRSQSDMYCLNSIETDYHTDPTPQILRINITDDLYYLVSVRKRMNGDDLQTWYRWQNASPPNPALPAGIPDEGVLIERVINNGTQWDDINGDGTQQATEVQDWRVVVRGPPSTYTNDVPPVIAGIQNDNKLWKVGQEFKNETDGTTSKDLTDGVNISIFSKPIDTPTQLQYCIKVKFGAGATQPDAGLRPWRQAPSNGYETTDIWVDSPLNGYNTFRYGSWNDLSGYPVPVGNGDDPAIGSVNRIYARVHNFGTSVATNVNVKFKQSNPLGVGVPSDTAWQNIGSVNQVQFPNLASIPAGGFVDVYIEWTPSVTLTADQIAAGVFSFHSCIKVNVDQVAGETVLGNNEAQENIQNFEATPTRSPLFDYSFKLYNDAATAQLLHLTRLNNLPSGWNLSINNNLESVTIPNSANVTVPVTVTATGSSIVGSAFTVNIGVSKDIKLQQLNSALQTVAEHPAQMELGGFDFTVNVLADTSIKCDAYSQDGLINVVGSLDGFQGIHQAGTPLRAYAQLLYDNDITKTIPLDDRASGDVGANGVFKMRFSPYRENKGQVTQTPKFVRCLFPGTHLLASSSSTTSQIVTQAMPTSTIVPWFASQFHSNLALNQFWAPLFSYGNFACTLGHCPVLISGTHGRGARFVDISGTALQSSSPVNLGNSFSVGLWARRTRNNMAETLVSHGNTLLTGQMFNMGFSDDNRFVCSNYNDELTSSTVISDRDWHHYVCVVSGNQRRLFIDNVLDNSRVSAAANYAMNAPMQIGRRPDLTVSFDGTIDEVRVYNFGLTTPQISQLYTIDPIAVAPTIGLSFDDVLITESNSVFSYCGNLTCPVVYYPDVYYPDKSGASLPANSDTAFNRPNERFASFYMEPNHYMSYGVWPATTVTPYPGTDSSLMFWGRLDDASDNNYPLVQSSTNPYVNRPSVYWTGSTHTLQYAGLNVNWDTYDNQWHLFTFVKSGTTLQIYIDNNKVAEGIAPAGLQPFRVAAGSTLNVGAVNGGELAAVEVSPFAFPYEYIKWRYENGIPNPATAQPTTTPQSTATPTRTYTASPTFTRSMTPTGIFSAPTQTWYKITVVNPSLTALAGTQTAIAATSQADQFNRANPQWATATAQAAGLNMTATAVRQTQVAEVNTMSAANKNIQGTQTALALAGKTATPFIFIPATFVVINFPTLVPSYTSTATWTKSPTRNPAFTFTNTRTNTTTRTVTQTRTNTATITTTKPPTSTRTRISTPTFITLTATATATTTPISLLYGPDAVNIMRLPRGMLARALQFIADSRSTPCDNADLSCTANDWQDVTISDVAVPLYRPDIYGGSIPAYYELSLFDRATKQSRGFIMMTNRFYNQCSSANYDPTCGIVDYPISHWNSNGLAISAQLQPSASQSGGAPLKLWRLDTLSYVAIRDTEMVGTVGAFPVLIDGLNTAYNNGISGSADSTWSPENSSDSDNRDPDKYMIDPVTTGISDTVAQKMWKFNDMDIKNNFSQYVNKYPFAFAPLLSKLKQSAAPQWRYEDAVIDPARAGDPSDTTTDRYNLPVQENTTTSIVLPFRNITLANIIVDNPSEKRISYTLDGTYLAGFPVLKITTLAMPTDELPRLRLSFTTVQLPYGVMAKYTFFMTGKASTAIQTNAPAASFRASRSWSSPQTFFAGTSADQRNYNQFDIGGGCQSGCGPTAWMMLFGWVDYKSSISGSGWGRWNVYRAGGTNTGASTGSSGVAPQAMDDGVRNAVNYIRGRVGTFCFGSSGATTPWDMDEAAHYLNYVGTGMSLDTHYNAFGDTEDRLTRYTIDHLTTTATNRRPVIIGIGWFSHYPLAWGVQYRTRPEGFTEGWFDGDDVVWSTYWYLNYGWGGSNNGWIQSGTWFAGRVSK